MDVSEFDKIRPYTDKEVPAAINRVLKEEKFRNVLSYLYRDQNIDQIIEKYKKIDTVAKFQDLFSHYAVRKIVRLTSDGLSFSGLNNLDHTKPYLFIANHRDIALDSAIMQALLYENNHKTTQITFGSNLMRGDLVIDIGKLNKMFTLYRGGSKIQMYRNALLHSGYIRHVITELKESIWIAQRDGRTKDGDDKTQIGLLKMFAIGRKDFIPALKELNIIPVSISYEYEPCDAQKTQELYLSKNSEYKKQPGEDFNSILNGIKSYKGHINMTFGTLLNNYFDKISDTNAPVNDLFEMIINEIDRQNHNNYALWPGNYVAYDIYKDANQYSKIKYTQEQKEKFINYVDKKISELKGEKKELTNMFIKMYAMPVINKNQNQ